MAYSDGETLYYQHEILPGVRLIGLNTNAFEADGSQIGVGYLDEEQLTWLDDLLPKLQDDLVLVMLHHNVLEHLPGQAKSAMGQRYMVHNHQALIQRLEAAHVPLMFTGHLHVQEHRPPGKPLRNSHWFPGQLSPPLSNRGR